MSLFQQIHGAAKAVLLPIFGKEVSQRQVVAQRVRSITAGIAAVLHQKQVPSTDLEHYLSDLVRQGRTSEAYSHLYAHLRGMCDRAGLYVALGRAGQRCYPALDDLSGLFKGGKFQLQNVSDTESTVTYSHRAETVPAQPKRPQPKAVSKALNTIMERNTVLMGQTVEL